MGIWKHLAYMQWYEDKCLTSNSYQQQQKECWFIAFANFCHVNTANMTNFKLPMWHYWVQVGRDAHSLFLQTSMIQITTVYFNPQQNWLKCLAAPFRWGTIFLVLYAFCFICVTYLGDLLIHIGIFFVFVTSGLRNNFVGN